MNKEFYELTAKDIAGRDVKMDSYKGKTLLIVNTATQVWFNSSV